MKKLIPILTLIALISCNQPTKNNTEETILKLEKQVDSLGLIFKTDELLIDSLLNLDPSNKIGLFQMIQLKQNERDYKSVCSFSKLYFQHEQFSIVNLIYGTSLEQLGYLDSARSHYQYVLDNSPDSLWNGNFVKPGLMTIVHGKDSAFNYLNNQERSAELAYLRLTNSIRNYQGLGYREFFIFPFPELTPLNYYVTIPDSLFNTGEVNSMQKLSLFFAKYGINIYSTGTDSAKHGYYFSSSEEYRNMIEDFDLLSVSTIEPEE